MKISFILITMLFSSQVFAGKAPSYEIVNQYVNLATTTEYEVLRGDKAKGKWECNFHRLYNDPSFVGYGDNMQKAANRLQLVCIKSQCQKVGQMALEAEENLHQMSDKEYHDLIEFLGFSSSDAEDKTSINPAYLTAVIFTAMHTNNRRVVGPIRNASVAAMTCENSSEDWRTVAFDSCFNIPIACSKI